MTKKEVLDKLKEFGSEKLRKDNMKRGAGENQYGVKMGDIRAIANSIKKDHKLAMSLWETGHIEARQVAILIVDVKALTATDIDGMVKSIDYAWLADWFSSYVIKEFAEKESLREKWMKSSNRWAARAGWSLMAGKVTREAQALDLDALLDRIEKEMPEAASEVQWTMNTTLAQIGINSEKHRKRAIDLGEKMGIYRDYPVSKGCTSPFAPIWINEMVKRKKN